MDNTPNAYAPEQLDAIAQLLLAGHGPVGIARILGVSRPTANRMIAAARLHGGLPPSRRMSVLRGEHRQVAKAQRLIGEGKSDRAIFRELGVSRTRGLRILAMARELTTAAIVSDTSVLERRFGVALDVLDEVLRVHSTLGALTAAMLERAIYLSETREFDGASPCGWHKRQRIVLLAFDLTRRLQESILKSIDVHQYVIDRYLDTKRLMEAATDISDGVRDGLAELKAAGDLACSVDQAAAVLRGACLRRTATRKGLL